MVLVETVRWQCGARGHRCRAGSLGEVYSGDLLSNNPRRSLTLGAFHHISLGAQIECFVILELVQCGNQCVCNRVTDVFGCFGPGGPWKPYLGAGIGYAKASLDISTSGTKIMDDSDNVFAYQAMAGVGYMVSASTTIYGGHKYFATENPYFTDVLGIESESEVSSHNIEVGVRFGF